MAELVIRLQKYIGVSQFNWETFEFEMATSADDVRMAVEYAGYAGEPATSILLEIGTCFGGSTFEGREIYKYLESTGLPVRTRILGFAASMATVLMLVGDECEMDASAQLLVHGPSGGTEGTVTDMQSSLKMLTNEHEGLRDIYVARTGQPVEVVEEWKSKDTFFTAQEALAAGLVTKVLPIAPKVAPALTDAQASARRSRFAGIVARTAKRPAQPRAASPTPKTKNAAQPAPTPRPMAKKVSTASAAARRPTAAAAKPTALNANQKAVAAFAKQLDVSIKMEGEATPTTNGGASTNGAPEPSEAEKKLKDEVAAGKTALKTEKDAHAATKKQLATSQKEVARLTKALAEAQDALEKATAKPTGDAVPTDSVVAGPTA